MEKVKGDIESGCTGAKKKNKEAYVEKEDISNWCLVKASLKTWKLSRDTKCAYM